MATPRKPLPDHASRAVDDALMSHASAIRKLTAALQMAERTEQQVLILWSLNEIKDADQKLRTIRRSGCSTACWRPHEDP
jgi:hypothetical protein